MEDTRSSLLRRVRDPQDRESWREFVELYEPLLLSYVRSRGLDANEARDVAQEIFISLLKSLPTFTLDHERGRFRTWLFQGTMNTVRNHFRRRESRGRAEDGWRAQPDRAEIVNGEPDQDWLQAHRRRVLEFVLPKVQSATQARTWHCFEQHVLRGRSGVDI